MSIDWWPAAFAVIVSAGLMPVAMLARRFGHDHDFSGVQKVHDVPTSRLGGVMLGVAYILAVVVAMRVWDQEVAALRTALCCLPVVLVGLWEDLTQGVHPWQRLIGALASAILATIYAGGTIISVDVPIVDDLLRYAIIAAPVTWFMVAGACNAMNLIDGAHGLAGGVALMMFGGLAAAAWQVGDAIVLAQALTVAGVVAGFLLWNYPRGKVFLGDAGAYFLGFMYAELSIQIVNRNDPISAWFVIALAAYPITETLYSIYRRKFVLRTASMEPDAAHLHSLIFRTLAVRDESAANREPKNVNARVAPRLWLHQALCLTAALLLIGHTAALMTFTAVYVVFYVVSYRVLARHCAVRFEGRIDGAQTHR